MLELSTKQNEYILNATRRYNLKVLFVVANRLLIQHM